MQREGRIYLTLIQPSLAVHQGVRRYRCTDGDNARFAKSRLV